MVYSRAQQEGMEMGPERSKPLHNFTLPCSLKWGNQKHLRCMKVDDSSTTTTTVDDHHQQHKHQHHQRHQRQRRSPPSKLGIKTNNNNNNNNNNSSGSIITTRRQLKILKEGQNDVGGEEEEDEEDEEEEEEGIEAVREKIMMDLKTAADKMKDMILREEEEQQQQQQVSGEEREKEREGSPTEEVRPWNLRTRRAACKAPIGGSGSNKGVLRIEEKKVSSFSPMRTDKLKEKERPPKFAVALTKKEIEEDFMAMTGHRPPRRPKKRPRIVQKQLDTLFPGLWLTGITADSYKVEFPENGKR